MPVPSNKISTWRERIGQPENFPLHSPTDVERAMVAEIAELRAAQPAEGSAPEREAFAWAAFAENGNVIIWSKNRAEVEPIAAKYGRAIVPVIALCAPERAAAPADFREQISGAVARGWCAAKNATKIMDSDLAFAIVDEVEALFRASEGQAQTSAAFLQEAPIECWSSDQEYFNAQSLGELIYSHESLRAGDTVWVGEAISPEPCQLIDAEDIMTAMGERAYDIAGEHADDYPNVTKEAEQALNDFLSAWIWKHAHPTFWTVANVKPYVLSNDDFPNNLTPVECDVPVAAPAVAKSPAVEQVACTLPPPGWNCTRAAGHDGPCAAWPEPPGSADFGEV